MEVNQNSERALRQAVVRLLSEKGYRVKSVAEGSGSPEFSRIEALRGTERLICAVKVTTRPHGRISFTRNPDESWKVLDDVDHVIHAWQRPTDPNNVAISVYEAKVVREAFETNFLAKSQIGMGHTPCWVSPLLEGAPRFRGAGFGKWAIWTQNVPLLAVTEPIGVAPVKPPEAEQPTIGIMDRIKQMLSEHMGVRPELIEVDVRVKL